MLANKNHATVYLSDNGKKKQCHPRTLPYWLPNHISICPVTSTLRHPNRPVLKEPPIWVWLRTTGAQHCSQVHLVKVLGFFFCFFVVVFLQFVNKTHSPPKSNTICLPSSFCSDSKAFKQLCTDLRPCHISPLSSHGPVQFSFTAGFLCYDIMTSHCSPQLPCFVLP